MYLKPSDNFGGSSVSKAAQMLVGENCRRDGNGKGRKMAYSQENSNLEPRLDEEIHGKSKNINVADKGKGKEKSRGTS